MAQTDKLTVYMVPIARRSLVLYPPASTDIAIDLPNAYIPNSATALFGKLEILPSEFQGQQLLISLPVGDGVVKKDEKTYSGTIENIGSTDVTVRVKGDELLRISQWTSININKRFASPKIALSYSMKDIKWTAEHTVLIDSVDFRVVGLKTIANVKNDSGIMFNSLSDLTLSLGRPFQEFQNQDQDDSPRYETKRMSMAAAAPMAKRSRMVENVDSQTYQGSGIDYEFPLGPQQLKEEKVFTIRNISKNDLVSKRVFSHNLYNGNQEVLMGFAIEMPATMILPAGLLKVVEIDHKTEEPSNLLGSVQVPEFRGTESGVSENFAFDEKDQKDQDEESEGEDENEDKEYESETKESKSRNDDNDFVFMIGQSRDVFAETNIQSQTVSGKRNTNVKPKQSLVITPSPIENDQDEDQDQDQENDERKLGLDITTIKLTTRMTNRTSKPVTVTLNYPIPTQNVLSVVPKFDKIKNGKWKWNILLDKFETDKTIEIVVKYAQ